MSGRSCNKNRTKNISGLCSRGLMTREGSRQSSGISNRRSRWNSDILSSSNKCRRVSNRTNNRTKTTNKGTAGTDRVSNLDD